MFCNYPVALTFYLVAAALLISALFPRYLETAIKSRYVWLAGAAAFVAGMLLLPSQNHLLGDGMQRLADVGQPILYTEPLDVLVHRLIYLIVGSTLWSYRIVGFVTGLFYLNGIRLLVKFGMSPIEKAIIALALLCTATIQFYFGYVESYGLLNLFILYYLYFAWKCVREERLTAAPAVFFALATLSHLSGAALFPSLVFLYKDRFRWVTKYVLPLAIVAVGVIFFFGRYWRDLVALLPNDYSAYSLFSGAHLLDLLSLLLLISPAFFLAVWKAKTGRQMMFTIVALAGVLCFTVLIDPKIGALRDWDLLSIFAIPLAGLIALRAPRHHLTIVTLLVLIVIRIVPWLVFNSKPQDEFVKRSVGNDLHYTQKYDNGFRLVSWGTLLYKIGDWQGAKAAWVQRLSYAPDHINTLSMLAPLLFKMGEFPESYQTYLRMLELQPDNLDYRYRASYLLFRMGDFVGAQRLLPNVPPEFRANPTTQRLIAGILGATGYHREAIEIVEKNPLEDTDGYLPYVLAKSCLEVGRIELARELIGRAVELDPANQNYRELAGRIPQQ